jgi:geranylgeranyl pyrophosphate synthase
MHNKRSKQELCNSILEENGGVIADKTRTMLLHDPSLRDLHPPLEFLSRTWRDPLTPAMMNLSCATVKGNSEIVQEAASAMSLINLSFRIWDDIIDKTPIRSFKPTLYGRFGESTSLIVGGLVTAKAFSILAQMDINYNKRRKIDKLLWNLLAKMARAEKVEIELRSQQHPSSKDKFWKIKTEAADLGTCMKIGATLGGGSQNEILHLGKFGLCLGIVMELWKDFHVSLNLTLELKQRILNKALPFAVIWASERSDSLKRKLEVVSGEENEPNYTKQVVGDILDTGALDRIVRTMAEAVREGVAALLRLESRKEPVQTLQSFIEAQPELFAESLSKSKAN